MWEFVNDRADVDDAGFEASVVVVAPAVNAAAAAPVPAASGNVVVTVAVLVLQTLCGVGGGAGQELMLLLLLMFENDGLRSDVCLNPLTGCNGYYRPAIRTQSRFSLLYQIPAKTNNIYICTYIDK